MQFFKKIKTLRNLLLTSAKKIKKFCNEITSNNL